MEKGKSIPFSLVCNGLTTIENQIGSGKGSNKFKVVVLSNIFRTIMHLKSDELIYAVYFLLSKVAPDHENIEIGIGEATVVKAISTALATSAETLTSMIANSDAKDLGEAALICKLKQVWMVAPGLRENSGGVGGVLLEVVEMLRQHDDRHRFCQR